MSFCSDEKTMRALTKTHRCHWCGQRINIGELYVTYFYTDGCTATRMKLHPECHAAVGRYVEQTDETEFDPYIWTRGCTCEAGDVGHGTYPTCTPQMKPRTDVYPPPDGKLLGEVTTQHYNAATGQYETVQKQDLVG